MTKSTAIWEQFRLPLAEGTPQPTDEEREQQFQKFREALSAEGALDTFKTALNEAFAPLMEKGVLEKLPPEHDANDENDRRAPRRHERRLRRSNVPVSDVLIENATSALQKVAATKMPSPEVADRVFARLKSELPDDAQAERRGHASRAEEDGRRSVERRWKSIPAGTVLASAHDENGNPLPIDDAALEKLQARIPDRTRTAGRSASKLTRSLAVLGMYVALYVLCGFYIYHREPRIIDDLRPAGHAAGAGRASP